MTQSASHLAALDGLGGIAALAVMLMHIGTWLDQRGIAPNSIVAVDFFFCLSGYVLCLAYGPKFDRGMTAATFLSIRLIRLVPVIVSNARWGRWFVPLLALTLVVFLLPFALPFSLRWLWCVIVSPMLVLSGAIVAWQGGARRVALVPGALSYPLYALHWPILVWVNGLYQQIFGHRDVGIALIGAPAVLMGSWLVLYKLDQPVRRSLTVITTARY